MWQNYLKQHTLLFCLAVMFMSVQGAMLGVLSYLIGPMFDEIFENRNTDALILLGGGVLGVFCLRGLSGFAQRGILAHIGERINFDLKRYLMRHVLTLDTNFYGQYSPGDLLTRVQGDSEVVKSIWAGFIGPGVRDLVAMFSCLVVAVSVDPLWTLVTCVGVPILVVPIARLQKLVKNRSVEQRSHVSSMTVLMDEVFHGIQIVKLYLLENILYGRFAGLAERVRKLGVKLEIQNAAVPAMVDIIAGIGFFGMLLLGGNEVISGEKTTGQFMSFFTAIVLLFDPLKRLSALSTAWQSTLASLERVYTLVQFDPSSAQ